MTDESTKKSEGTSSVGEARVATTPIAPSHLDLLQAIHAELVKLNKTFEALGEIEIPGFLKKSESKVSKPKWLKF